MTTHEQIHIMNQMLNGAFQETLYLTMTWLAYSFYSHVLSLMNVHTHTINPYEVGAHIQYDKELAKQVLDDLIQRSKEPETSPNSNTEEIYQAEEQQPSDDLLSAAEATLYTIRELKALARKQSIKGYSYMKKAELLKVVQLH